MKISDYPKTLPYKELYTPGELAILLSISRRTAIKLIDSGAIPGYVTPGTRNRKVPLGSINMYLATHPEYQHLLRKITHAK
jgi:excisionase family DNA binding protein